MFLNDRNFILPWNFIKVYEVIFKSSLEINISSFLEQIFFYESEFDEALAASPIAYNENELFFPCASI